MRYTLRMPKRPGISATIITLNEEKKLKKCLESLSWADEIIVVDSGSTDSTREIAKALGARVFQHPWLGYGQQKNYAMSQCSHDWVLNVDADEIVTEELRNSICDFLSAVAWSVEGARGAALPRLSWYLGRWIRHGGWYPNYLVRLSDRRYSRWTEPRVHEALVVDGKVEKLNGDLLHYTFDSVGDQVAANIRYARLGASVARERGERASWLRLIFKPFGKFLETYFWKLGFLDGFPGFVISMNAAHSMFMKYVELRIEASSRN